MGVSPGLGLTWLTMIGMEILIPMCLHILYAEKPIHDTMDIDDLSTAKTAL